MISWGPFETEAATRNQPMSTEIREAREKGLRGANNVNTRVRHMFATCAATGVVLGARDLSTIGWLANWEDSTVEVIIGMIRRAHAAGVAQGKADRPNNPLGE